MVSDASAAGDGLQFHVDSTLLNFPASNAGDLVLPPPGPVVVAWLGLPNVMGAQIVVGARSEERRRSRTWCVP